MDLSRLARLMAAQEGVVSRGQILAAGGTDADVERLLRRRDLVRIHRGVFVDHTGPLTWTQRAWAAVLLTAPSALSGSSALRAHRLRGYDDDETVEVAVQASRSLVVPACIKVVRMRDFDAVAQLHLTPPRIRLEPALLSVASAAPTDDRSIAVLADACQERRTTVGRLSAQLARTRRVRRRALLEDVLAEVSTGVCSALERRYLADVERRHGLPRGRPQVWASRVVRDVEYGGCATVVELDGRLGHEWTADRWADLDRDVDAAVNGLLTVRAGWRQVLEPCRLADRVAGILVARGWAGTPRRCGTSCRIQPQRG